MDECQLCVSSRQQKHKLTQAKRYRTLGMTRDCHSMSSSGGSTAVKRDLATFCWAQYQFQ